MPAKDPLLFVIHIRDCCERIVHYTAGISAGAPYEQIVMDAVCRNLQIIGEAARKVDDLFKQEHPEIPWSSTIGLRNVIVHAYDGVLPEVIQEIVERDIPPLLQAVRNILQQTRG